MVEFAEVAKQSAFISLESFITVAGVLTANQLLKNVEPLHWSFVGTAGASSSYLSAYRFSGGKFDGITNLFKRS